MATQKHLTLEDCYAIQQALEKRHSFRNITISLDKDPTTISKQTPQKTPKILEANHRRIFQMD